MRVQSVPVTNEESAKLGRKRIFDASREDVRGHEPFPPGKKSRRLLGDGTTSWRPLNGDVSQTTASGSSLHRVKEETVSAFTDTMTARKRATNAEYELNGLAFLCPSEFFGRAQDRSQYSQPAASDAASVSETNNKENEKKRFARLMVAFGQVVTALQEYVPEEKVIGGSREHVGTSYLSKNAPEHIQHQMQHQNTLQASDQLAAITSSSGISTMADGEPLQDMGRGSSTNIDNVAISQPGITLLAVNGTLKKDLVAGPEVRESIEIQNAGRAFSVIGTRSFYGGSPRPYQGPHFGSPLTHPNSSPFGPSQAPDRERDKESLDRDSEAKRTPRSQPIDKGSSLSGLTRPRHEDTSPIIKSSQAVLPRVVVEIPRKALYPCGVIPTRESIPLQSEFNPGSEFNNDGSDLDYEVPSPFATGRALHEVKRREYIESSDEQQAPGNRYSRRFGRTTLAAARGRVQEFNLNFGPTEAEMKCFPNGDCSQTRARAKLYPKNKRASDEHLLEVGKLSDSEDRHQNAPYAFGLSEGQLLAEYRYLALRTGADGAFAWAKKDIKRLLRNLSYETAMDIADFRRKVRRRMKRARLSSRRRDSMQQEHH